MNLDIDGLLATAVKAMDNMYKPYPEGEAPGRRHPEAIEGNRVAHYATRKRKAKQARKDRKRNRAR